MSKHRLTQLVIAGSKRELTEAELLDFLPLFLLSVDHQRDDIYTAHAKMGVEMYVWIDFILLNIDAARTVRQTFADV